MELDGTIWGALQRYWWEPCGLEHLADTVTYDSDSALQTRLWEIELWLRDKKAWRPALWDREIENWCAFSRDQRRRLWDMRERGADLRVIVEREYQ
jgi:hypothetical protein